MAAYKAHETAVIDPGCVIGDDTRVWHFSHIMSGCTIGKRCNIGQNVVISPSVVLGNNVKVQNNVSVYTGVTCEDDVFLGPSCVFTNVVNPRSAFPRKDSYLQTRICRGATVGANAMIGAGAVVTKDIPPFALVVGNPSMQIGWVSERGNRLCFDEEGFAVCPESGEKYRLKDGKVSRVG